MKEKPEGTTPPQESKEIQDGKFESAIKEFFKEQWPEDPHAKKPSYGFDFDISDPKLDDMTKAQSGNFEITNFHTSPTSDPEKLSFHFYIGNTEFHIAGKAADRIYELMKESKMKIDDKESKKFKPGDKIMHEANITSFGARIEEVIGFSSGNLEIKVGEGKQSYLPEWEKGFLSAEEGIKKAIEYQKSEIKKCQEKLGGEIKKREQQIELLEKIEI